MAIPTLVLLLPLLSAVVIMGALKKNAQLSALVATASCLATLVLSLLMLFGGAGGEGVAVVYNWINLGAFQLDIATELNALSKSMLLIVTFIGSLVHVFSLGYMADDEGKARFFAGLSLFMFSMTGIVLAANLPMMFIFWELVGVSSYILIGHWYTKNSAADAAKKAFLTNRIGDFGFMIGILLIWSLSGGKLGFAELKAWAASGPVDSFTLNAAVVLLFCGAVGKSAQLPLHVWLPDAMEGPTPVSALIHAATMVAAGVYMMVKIGFLVAAAVTAQQCIAWIGGLTALMAALMATQQNDIKRVLAYSTLSQLGYMIMAVGLNAGEAGYFHLYTHAFFKALLFLGSGAIIYACHHEQDIWKMGGLRRKMPVTFLTFGIGTAALIAVPFITSGFYSKDTILGAAAHGNKMLFLIASFTAFLTAFYMTRLFVVTFLGKPRDEGADHAHEVPLVMKLPLIILAVPSLIAGFGFVAHKVLGEYYPAGDKFQWMHEHHTLVVVVSAVTLALGVVLGWRLYAGKSQDPLSIRLFANKFYFDEFYAKVIGICQDGLAALVRFLDALLIDGLGVRGSSLAASGLGQALRRLQVGNLQGYAFIFGLGVILLLIITFI